ncbi:MAG: 3-oxoacyl-ACP reductase FabG [Oscillospiraceae bacterium]|nr:3-oxoacyl-ACP reductase FabG [Oscillospiraceae bacterium]
MSKTAWVTGASSGIGAATALALAEKGYDIAVGCHSEDSITRGGGKVAEDCRAFGVKAECFVGSVEDFDDCAGLVGRIVEQMGGIDLLVNCAGITRDGLIARMSEEQFDQVIDVNLKGAFCAIRHVSPLMMKKRAGKIINIASVIGLGGNAGQANYAASKGGVIAMTKSVAKELGGRGITCNAIAPGFIETKMTAVLPEKAMDAVLSATALGRPGKPEEVAHAVLFLAENDFVTGQVIVVDGGLHI